jgi:ABC-type transporter Mla MlaB component
VFSLFSEVAEHWGDELENAWNELQNQRQGAACVIDLSNVKAIDSAGVGIPVKVNAYSGGKPNGVPVGS